MTVSRFFLGALFAFPAAFLSACAGVSPPAQRAQLAGVSEEKKRPAVDPKLLQILSALPDDDEDLFTPFPSIPVTPQKVEGSEKVLEKKEPPQKVAKNPQEPPTVLQEAPGPKADDRLLGLWQMDLEKAMQQPPGRRKIQFSMPIVENDRVRYFVDYFARKKRDFFERALSRSGKYIPMMATILQEEGLPQDLVYLSLIESGFSPYALSKAKALGLWQFIRSTGMRYGLKINYWLDERRDPVKSTRAAAAYLKDLHLQFGEWFLAAAAYNAGENKVEKAMNRSKTNDFWRLSQKTYLKSETRNYVPKFIAATLIANDLEKYGFGDVSYEPPIEYDEVEIRRPLQLKTVASLANTTVRTIKELNPALLREITPPTENGFLLRLPAGSGGAFTQAYEALPDSAHFKVITHKVKKGETLLGIAKKYRQKVSELMELNGLKDRRIRVGQDLIVVFDGASKK